MLEPFKELLSGLKQVKLLTWIGLAIATALLIVIGAWLSSWSFRVIQDWVNLQQNPNDATKKQFDASLELVKTIIGSLGTLATIIGGIILYLNFRVANQNAATAIKTVEIANQNAAIANKTVELTASRLITEGFSKAVEQLGSDKIEVRLGGIYSLERIAQDSDRDHWTIMEVLTAFVREKSPVEIAKSKTKKSFAEHHLKQSQMATPSFLSVTKDVQAALTVIGRRNEGKEQSKYLDLSLSNLSSSNLSRANLVDANLTGANLTGANLGYANFSHANLSNADLSHADLMGATLSNANLNRANLVDAILIGANLSRINFIDANLSRAILSHANLVDAILIGANLSRTVFSNTNLSSANLSDVDLSRAILINANLSRADLSGASLSSSEGLTEEQLKDAKLCKTKMPDGTTNNRNCSVWGISEE